jgi:hypothetical protein
MVDLGIALKTFKSFLKLKNFFTDVLHFQYFFFSQAEIFLNIFCELEKLQRFKLSDEDFN